LRESVGRVGEGQKGRMRRGIVSFETTHEREGVRGTVVSFETTWERGRRENGKGSGSGFK
jgi:hypothetical protein